MRNDKLIRIGDTSFRLENQINFYVNLMNEIYDYYCDKNFINLDEIYEILNNKKIINYKNNKNINRSSLMVKQLLFFKILNKDKNKNFTCSKLFMKYMEISNNRFKEFHKKTLISFDEVFFLLLILLNDKKNSKNMKIFIKFLNDKETIDDNSIALFSFCDSIDEMNEFSTYKRDDVLKKLFNPFNKNDLEEIIDLYNQNNCDVFFEKKAFKKINSIMKKNKNPSFKKGITGLKNFMNILSCNHKNLFDILQRDQYTKKNINKIIKLFYNIENINECDFILENKLNIFNYFILMKKYELIYKDYLDINRRWFLNTKLIKHINSLNDKKNNIKKYIVNKKILSLLLEIMDKYKILDNNNLEEIFNFSLNYLATDSEIKIDYPFDKDEVSNILEAYYIKDEKFIYEFLKKKKIANVGRCVIFEYFVNLSFSLSYNYDPKDFVDKYCSTKLDSNLLPITHAPGKRSDGLIIDVENNHKIFSTIESTILNNQSIHKEKESIQRHSYDYLEKNKYLFLNDLPICIFVINEKLLENEIRLFSSDKHSYYIKKLDKKIRIILLNSRILSNLLRKNKLDKLLRSFLNKIPFHEIECGIKLDEWYINLFDEIH